MNQSFYIKLDDQFYLYIDDRYLRCTYTTNSQNEDVCIVSNDDDFEISITGNRAFDTFIKIQEFLHENNTIHWQYLVGELGMKQYG